MTSATVAHLNWYRRGWKPPKGLITRINGIEYYAHQLDWSTPIWGATSKMRFGIYVNHHNCTTSICKMGSPYADFLVIPACMCMGFPYMYGDPHIENVAYGDPKCYFPYGNGSHMHTVSDWIIPVCIWAYGDHSNLHTHTGIKINPRMHTVISVIPVCLREFLCACGDHHLHMGISVCILLDMLLKQWRTTDSLVNGQLKVLNRQHSFYSSCVKPEFPI